MAQRNAKKAESAQPVTPVEVGAAVAAKTESNAAAHTESNAETVASVPTWPPPETVSPPEPIASHVLADEDGAAPGDPPRFVRERSRRGRLHEQPQSPQNLLQDKSLAAN